MVPARLGALSAHRELGTLCQGTQCPWSWQECRNEGAEIPYLGCVQIPGMPYAVVRILLC